MKSDLFFFILLFYKISRVKGDLLSVFKIFRHGERTPVAFYLTDPYKKASFWNGLGPGELTERGKQQCYQLGQYFRNRYDSFIGNEYVSTEVLVRSSQYPRNIGSAKAFLEGVYGNVDIPIIMGDVSVLGNPLKCFGFNWAYFRHTRNSEEIREVNKNNRKLYINVVRKTVFPFTVGLETAYLIWDTLYVESAHNLSLPKWTADFWPEPLMQMAKNMSKFLCSTEQLGILGTGVFFKKLFEYFELIIQGNQEPKIILTSAHDINIICLLSVFGYYESNPPDIIYFASSLFFELWQDERTKGYFVRTFFKSSVESKEILLTVRGCQLNCNLDKFKNVLSNFTITKEDWYKRCKRILNV